MKLAQLNPWNWFKHEEADARNASQVPVNKADALKATENGAGRSLVSSTGVDSLYRLHREFDQMFDQLWNSVGFRSPVGRSIGNALTFDSLLPGTTAGDFRANVDISGDSNQYTINLDVPGFDESELSIDISGHVLTINGKRETNHTEKDKNTQYYRIERSYGSFQRTLSVPDDGNVDEINAQLKGGVLSILIPRRAIENKETKTIPITSH